MHRDRFEAPATIPSSIDTDTVKIKKRKERLDKLLVERGLASSREKAKRLIMAGCVWVGERRVTKVGAEFPADMEVEVKESPLRKYVSRGGLKLEAAIKDFGLSIKGKVCLDVGASTGGFTDCLLQNGAKKVYALDVGYGQLDWKLRNDPRVVTIEKTNIRYFNGKEIKNPVDLATIDVSFISLDKVLPKVKELIGKKGEIVSLIKPQFEAGREKVQRGGVVKDKKVHQEVIDKIKILSGELGLEVKGLTTSPIKGPSGNIEYFIYLRKKE
ncbi:TlyA family rRNA (cytidine-2'-O)-methyltransferase [bacterium]|nr:TlyA family rRNA (cytidine-2'-O)-methyltransferase [bacterium]NIN91981.1 TlyA family rRNA (cytidine-2'-O)-methyltransferase [bacterium]NIO18197.1 TlyA family rRNA (cytidine-2'-O)-methyltransferase [bacterium]NIO73171.1 TlyA family rRNA (cytidine-2'-O)-methyltransferase [bacterium]